MLTYLTTSHSIYTKYLHNFTLQLLHQFEEYLKVVSLHLEYFAVSAKFKHLHCTRRITPKCEQVAGPNSAA